MIIMLLNMCTQFNLSFYYFLFPCFSEGKEDPWQTLRKSSEDSLNMDYYNEEEKETKPLSSSSVKNLNSNSKKNFNTNNGGRKNQNSNQSSGSQGKKRIEKQEEEEEEMVENLDFYSNENDNDNESNNKNKNDNYNSKSYNDDDVRENDYDNVGEYDDSYDTNENTPKKSKKSGSGFLGLGRRKDSEQ